MSQGNARDNDPSGIRPDRDWLDKLIAAIHLQSKPHMAQGENPTFVIPPASRTL